MNREVKNNRFVLPLVIILLIVFLPITIYSVINRVTYIKEMGNPNHLHFLDNKLYYYNNANSLVGIYNCNGICSDAKASIDDEYLKYYEGENNKIDIFDNYAFINDDDIIVLYNLKTNIIIAKFSMIKTYGIQRSDNSLIVKNEDNKYGVLNLDKLTFDIPPEYDFIGLQNNVVDNVLDSSTYVVLKENKWYLVSNKNSTISEKFDYPIINFNNNYIFTKSNKGIIVYDYDGKRQLEFVSIKEIDEVLGNYIVKDNNDHYKIYNENLELQDEYGYYNGDFSYRVNGNIIEIYDKDVIIGTYEVKGS